MRGNQGLYLQNLYKKIDRFSIGRTFVCALALPFFVAALFVLSTPAQAQNQVCIQCASDGAASAGTAQCANAGGGWTAFSGDLSNNSSPAEDNSACRVRAVSGPLINAACEICIQCAFSGDTGSPDAEACVLADGSWSAYSGDRNNNAAPAADGLACRVSMECPSGCTGRTFGSGDTACTVNARNDGGTSGTCAEDGTCSYTCNNGSWIGTNSCTAAPSGGSPVCGGSCPPGSETWCQVGSVVGGGGSCNNAAGGVTNWQCTSGGSTVNCSYRDESCFIAGTKITMADGSEKAIENVQVGDVVSGMDGAENEVLKVHIVPVADRELYAFNGGDFFVTHEHPFMTTDGWKSIKPEATLEWNPKFIEQFGDIKPLQEGDILIKENGEKVTLETIESRDRYPHDMPVYNFQLTGNQTYYADGYLVHNK